MPSANHHRSRLVVSVTAYFEPVNDGYVTSCDVSAEAVATSPLLVAAVESGVAHANPCPEGLQGRRLSARPPARGNLGPSGITSRPPGTEHRGTIAVRGGTRVPEARSPEPGACFDLVEAGASNGRLARDILDAAQRLDPEFYAAIRLSLVE